MPYCENGLVPDLLVNVHSIPTRMAINQIKDCALSQLAAESGTIYDATAFRKVDNATIVAKLESEYGIKYGGYHRMYNGQHGNWLDTLIFVGPTCYQRLQKFVVDEQYATCGGPTAALTHQALEGKNNDGGLKIGEMEKDVIMGHGTARMLHDKFYADADGTDIYICRCGNRAIVNIEQNIYRCKYCGDAADITIVKSSWVANLLFNEAAAMNVKMTFGLEDRTFDEHSA